MKQLPNKTSIGLVLAKAGIKIVKPELQYILVFVDGPLKSSQPNCRIYGEAIGRLPLLPVV